MNDVVDPDREVSRRRRPVVGVVGRPGERVAELQCRVATGAGAGNDQCANYLLAQVSLVVR